MKVRIRDGFKFGLGCCLAYDLYKTIGYIRKWSNDEYKKYKAATITKMNELNAPDSNDESHGVKQKIGFTIE